MDGDHTESGTLALDAELARRLLERGFYLFEAPRRAPEGSGPRDQDGQGMPVSSPVSG